VLRLVGTGIDHPPLSSPIDRGPADSKKKSVERADCRRAEN
jgi:hypothetical protein